MNKAASLNAGLVEQLLAQGRVQELTTGLEQAAHQGHAGAAFLLACWLLTGNPIPVDLPRCRQFLRIAAQGGHPDACHIEIALMASGAGAPADWEGALARLRALAGTNAALSAQIALLEAMDLDAQGHPNVAPAGEQISAGPDAWLHRGLLSERECAHIMRISEMHLVPAAVMDGRTAQGIYHHARDCDAGTLGPPQEDLIVQAILRRVAAATGTPVGHGESTSVLRYRAGQQYRHHLDTLPPGFNQRLFTTILYLNEDYEGGETHFRETGLKVKGRTGDALVFRNVTADGRSDMRTSHACLPITRGTKWVATRWIRERPYSPWTRDEKEKAATT